jgi:hypothetical protein
MLLLGFWKTTMLYQRKHYSLIPGNVRSEFHKDSTYCQYSYADSVTRWCEVWQRLLCSYTAFVLWVKEAAEGLSVSYLEMYTCYLCSACFEQSLWNVPFTQCRQAGEPNTVAARPKAWTVFAHSNTGVVGSNPTRGMDVCVRLFCVCVVLCVGRGNATGWSLSKEFYRLCID